MRTTFALAVLVAWLAAPAAGQDATHELKLKREAKGDRVRVASTDAANLRFLFAVMGQELKKTDTKVEKLAYTEEILEYDAKAKKATKLTRAYTVAEEAEDGKKKTQAYAGKTVLIEMKGAKYAFFVDGRELDEDDTEDLDREFNEKDDIPLDNADLMPDKPVKVNETWTVSAKKVAEAFDAGGPLSIDPDNTKVTGKLVKVYEKGGKRFGVMELTMVLAVKELRLDEDTFTMKAGSKVTATMTLDACIDGSSHAGTEKGSLTFELTGDLPNGKIEIGGTAKYDKTVEDVGK